MAAVLYQDEKAHAFVSTEPSHNVETHHCTVHTGEETKQLDKQLQNADVQAFLQSVILALEAIRDENQCTKCAIESSSTVLSGQMKTLKAMKKNGQWTKDEKKALKNELKSLNKGFKKMSSC